MSVAENIYHIRQRMIAAALRAGRSPEMVKLMAVTKTVPIGPIREAIAVGVDLIGENYLQEAQGKIESIGETIPWHFTGHLQTNKARQAARLFSLIHSVDRVELARELSRRAEGRVIHILIEVNTGNEATKSGVALDEVLPLLKEIAVMPNVAVKGLMTIPPWSADPEESRPFFRGLRVLAEKIKWEAVPGVELAELSMGMSDDFEVAIEEGATIVRVGRAIFGPRPA